MIITYCDSCGKAHDTEPEVQWHQAPFYFEARGMKDLCQSCYTELKAEYDAMKVRTAAQNAAEWEGYVKTITASRFVAEAAARAKPLPQKPIGGRP